MTTIFINMIAFTTIKQGVWVFFLKESTSETSPQTTSHTRYFFENLELLKFYVRQYKGLTKKHVVLWL